MRDGDWKLILADPARSSMPAASLFCLDLDPGERRSLLADHERLRVTSAASWGDSGRRRGGAGWRGRQSARLQTLMSSRPVPMRQEDGMRPRQAKPRRAKTRFMPGSMARASVNAVG